MAFSEHRFSFAGKKVMEFQDKLFDTATYAFRVRQSEDGGDFYEKLNALLALPEAATLEALVIGSWDEELFEVGSEKLVAALVAASGTLKNLKAIFLGDITYEECEVSWLHQSDIAPLLNAYPQLEVFAVRGSQDLEFKNLQHANLKQLIVQTGGLPVSVVRQILEADLPELEHLELYLGTEDYGADTQPDDLAPLLRGELFPKLSYLGLKDSDIADAIAAVLANAPILERLKTLDLSLGTLSDDGARALMASPYLEKLEKLDIHYHYVSPEVLSELKAHLRKLKVKIDASDPQEPEDEWRHVSIGE